MSVYIYIAKPHIGCKIFYFCNLDTHTYIKSGILYSILINNYILLNLYWH